MLDEKTTEILVEKIVSKVEEQNTYILKKIAETIKLIGTLTPTQARQLQQVLKYGKSYNGIINKIAQITKKNKSEINKILNAVAKNDYQFAEKFYKYKNVQYPSFKENDALQNQLETIKRLTLNTYENLSNTTAIGFSVKNEKGITIFQDISKIYQDTIDRAVLSVSQGKDTFDREMFKTLKELGTSGIKTIDYKSGRSMRLDSAIRMNMQGALRDLHNEQQNIIGEQYGADGIEISVHENPAIDHEKVQGKQFSKIEYEKLNSGAEARDYKGNIYTLDHDHKNGFRPISEMNCYHYIFNIVLGVSSPLYTEKQLKEIIKRNDEGFNFENKHYSYYEGTQLQRKLEREIRKEKDLQIMGRASENQSLINESQYKINILTSKYNKLLKASNLPKKADRLRVSMYHKVKIK